VALFAITLNFLQPLAHAALMRDGAPATWSSLCLAMAGENDQQRPTPVAGHQHECCLGLAHAPILSAPPTAFVALEASFSIADRRLFAADAMAPVGMRDGPAQPRGPPSHA
jgi:hypothetical protein